MGRATARAAAPAAVALAALVLSGCFMLLPAPGIEIMVKPAYNESEILIPYSLYGQSSVAHARWTLRRLDPGPPLEWHQIEQREVRLPSGSSGVLELGHLGEAKYELVFEMLTTRDRTYEVVPYLTQRRQFYVDRTPPEAAFVGLQYYNDGFPGGAPMATQRAELEVTAPAYDPNVESPVRILYTLNDPRPPVPDRDEYGPGRILLWEAGEAVYTQIIIVAVDAAGNRSGIIVEDWDP